MCDVNVIQINSEKGIFLDIFHTLHNSLHTAQAWFHELYVKWAFYTRFTHILRLQCVQSM